MFLYILYHSLSKYIYIYIIKCCKDKYFVYNSCFSPQQQPDDEINAPQDLLEKAGLYSNDKFILREKRKEIFV